MSDHALIIGKFYPPHAGHHFLIDTALSESKYVYVLVLAHPSETISGDLRAAWLREVHGEAQDRLRVYSVPCDLEVNYDSREADKAHAKLIYEALHGYTFLGAGGWWPKRLCMYSSEEYGPRIANDLMDLANSGQPEFCYTVEHKMVDQARLARPISARDIRQRPVENWHHLAGPVRRDLTKRFVVCGAESTGTTTLARDLAERFQTVWVPEWGRLFSEATGSHHRWTTDDFAEIMREQFELENKLARHAGPVMFCDTDAYATLMFHHLYLHQAAPEALWDVARDHTFEAERSRYFVTDTAGIPFEQDGYRLFPEQREWATSWFGEVLSEEPTVPQPNLIGGDPHSRLARASNYVKQDMIWSFGPAGDEA